MDVQVEKILKDFVNENGSYTQKLLSIIWWDYHLHKDIGRPCESIVSFIIFQGWGAN